MNVLLSWTSKLPIVTVLDCSHPTEVKKRKGRVDGQVVKCVGGKTYADPDGLLKDNAKLYFAYGPRLVPRPTGPDEYDVDDHDQRVLITPDYLDRLVRDSDTEAWMRGVRGISLWDRIIHLAAGAGIGLVLAFLLMRFIGVIGVAISTKDPHQTAQAAIDATQDPSLTG